MGIKREKKNKIIREKNKARSPPYKHKSTPLNAFPSNTSLCPGKTISAVSVFGTPKRIDGKKLEKTNAIEMEIMKKIKAESVKGIKTRSGKTLLI